MVGTEAGIAFTDLELGRIICQNGGFGTPIRARWGGGVADVEGVARVLIIDDEPDASEALARCLAKAGHEARCVRTGREALSALIDRVPDAILLDVRMPDMDGVEVLEVVRSYLRWVNVPIAMWTACAEAPRLLHVGALGVTRVFAKSRVDLDELLEWVEEQARRASPPGGGAAPSGPGLGL